MPMPLARKCVAVATGSFDEDQLKESKADQVVSDLVGFVLEDLPWF